MKSKLLHETALCSGAPIELDSRLLPPLIELESEGRWPDQARTTSASKFEKLYSPRAASQHFGVHYRQILRAIQRGDLPAYRLGSSRLKVRLSDIERLLQASKPGGANV